MKRSLLVIVSLFYVTATIAQVKISGLVRDTKGEKLIGVNIAIKGSYDGATTNQEGKYSFETTAQDTVVVTATYLGFASQEKKIYIGQNRPNS
jgi:hypothetical protein